MGFLQKSWKDNWVGVVLDTLWSGIVIAPLVVLYWRGTWDLLEDFIYPNRPDEPIAEDAPKIAQDRVPGLDRSTSGLICILSSLVVRILLDSGKFHFGEWLQSKHKIVKYCGGWLFNAINALFGVAFWRGVWFLYRLDLGVSVTTLAFVQVAGVVFLILMRIPKSLMASPLGVDMDDHEITFANGTFFRQNPSSGWKFFGDVIFTNVILRQVVVLTWWSCWSLENEFFYFQSPEAEVEVVSWDSLLLGYTLALVTVGLSQLLLRLTTTKLYIVKPLDILATLTAFYASVSVWRGLWSLQSNYFLPGLQQDENYLVSHFLGLFALTLLRVSNTIGNDNIVKDCEAEEVAPIQYWSLSSGNRSAQQGQEEMVPIVEWDPLHLTQYFRLDDQSEDE